MSVKKSFQVPSLEDLKKCSTAGEFQAAASCSYSLEFRPMVAVPPFIALAFIRHQSVDPAVLGLVAISATISFVQDKKDDPEVDIDKTEAAGYYIACFLWGIANNLVPNSVSSPAIHPEVLEWFNDLQARIISPRAPAPSNPNAMAQPSDATMATLATNIAQLTSYNIQRDQQTTKSDEEKRDKFKQWPEKSR